MKYLCTIRVLVVRFISRVFYIVIELEVQNMGIQFWVCSGQKLATQIFSLLPIIGLDSQKNMGVLFEMLLGLT